MTYRMHTFADGTRAKVVVRSGVEGFIARWVQECSGCTEYSEGTIAHGPLGCHECGYTGRRRNAVFVPLDMADRERRESEGGAG